MRVLTILLAVWGLVAAPTLCTAGVLPHACHCPDEAEEATPGHEGHEGHGGHEGECATDPCSDLTASPRVDVEAVGPLAPVASLAGGMSAAGCTPTPPPSPRRCRVDARTNLPLPPAALPLLS